MMGLNSNPETGVLTSMVTSELSNAITLIRHSKALMMSGTGSHQCVGHRQNLLVPSFDLRCDPMKYYCSSVNMYHPLLLSAV